MAARIAYTQYKRRNNPPILATAQNASSSRSMVEGAKRRVSEEKKGFAEITLAERTSSASSSEISLPLSSVYTGIRSPVAVFPQYIAQKSTIMTIREVDLPKLSDSFTVTLGDGQELFRVRRERFSFSHRQLIVDSNSMATILTVRRDIGKLPLSHRFDDVSDTQILDLQGNFSVPLQGARATAFFVNAADKNNVCLSMQGSWHNRHAIIKNCATDEVVATMKSELLNARNLVSSRRTYEVSVVAGMDLAVITGMIISLDARSS